MYNTDSQTVPADTLCESSSQVKIQLSQKCLPGADDGERNS